MNALRHIDKPYDVCPLKNSAIRRTLLPDRQIVSNATKAIPLPLEELVATAIENQHVILEFELKKGIPLNYLDEKGQCTLRYPDGHTEVVSLPEATEVLQSDNSV